MKYEPRDFSLLEKLEQLLQLGTCIKALHDLGYAHRDIKPKNLLLYKNRMYLSDFGLVWNQNSTEEHITEVNDRLGPMAIRPPELQPVKNVIEIDYRKSDVYLFAKTVWMILRCNREGFSREYSRVIDKICFVSSQLQVETAEPLHIMMEGATKHNYWERISKVDDIAYRNKVFPIIAGQIGISCCKRVEKKMQKHEFNGLLVIALPKTARKSDWDNGFSFNKLRDKLNKDPWLIRNGISFDRIISYKTTIDEFERIENKGIAAIHDVMIQSEIEMVSKLVSTHKINSKHYLLKDGSLEFNVNYITNARELRMFRNNFIDDCIGHIKDQINIIKGNIPESVLLQWKYNEKALIIEGSTPRSEIIYNDQPSILRILNELSGMVALVFSEPGKEYPQLPLRRANAIKDNIFELEVSTPNVNERNKSLFISIKYVSMEQDKSFQLCTEFCQSDIFERNVVCRRIDEVLTKSEKKIYLNGRYTIKLIQIQGSAVLAGKK